MKDKITIERVALLHPAFRNIVEAAIDNAEKKLGAFACIRVVQGCRTFEQQTAIYCQPWDKKDNDGDGKVDEADERVTNAKAGQSIHNYALAVDCAIMYDKDKNGSFESISWDLLKDMNVDGEADWKTMVKAFTALGCSWGGNWKTSKDNPHFEMGGYSDYKPLLAKYNAGKFIPGTKYLQLN